MDNHQYWNRIAEQHQQQLVLFYVCSLVLIFFHILGMVSLRYHGYLISWMVDGIALMLAVSQTWLSWGELEQDRFPTALDYQWVILVQRGLYLTELMGTLLWLLEWAIQYSTGLTLLVLAPVGLSLTYLELSIQLYQNYYRGQDCKDRPLRLTITN